MALLKKPLYTAVGQTQAGRPTVFSAKDAAFILSLGRLTIPSSAALLIGQR